MGIDVNMQSESKFRRILISPYTWLFFLFLLTFFAYSNTFYAPFVFDDIDNLTNNPYMRFRTLSWNYIKHLPDGLNGKRVISFITFGLNYYFDKYNVVGYHIVNFMIHLVNGLLLFFLIRRTLQFLEREGGVSTESSGVDSENQERREFRNIYIAIFASGLWLLNPVQIFSVTYTVQRMNSLSAMFSLLSLLCYISLRSGFRGIKNVLIRYTVLIFFILLIFLFAIFAVLSKQNAVLLPLFILLYEVYFISSFRFKYIIKRFKSPLFLIVFFLLLSPIVLLLAYIVYYNTGANPWKHIMSLYHGRDFTFFERIITQPRVLCYYLSLIFYPSPSRLAFLVDIPKSTGFLHPFSTLLSMVFLLGLFLSALFTMKRYRLFSFAVLWFFTGHLLESTVIPLELVYVHRNYLPSIFLFLPFLVWFFNFRVEDKRDIWRLRRSGGIVFILFLFAFWSYSYNAVWKTDVSFWADNVKKSPSLPRTYANYGAVLVKSGHYKEAHKALDQTLKMKPGDVRTLYNKGVAYEGEKEYHKAIKYYSKALRRNRKFADAWCNQGNVLVEIGRVDDGLQCLYAAWELQPFDSVINYHLGHTLMIMNNSKGAIFHLHRAEKSNPDYIDVLLDLGLIYTILGNDEAGRGYFLRVKALDPRNKLANDMLEMKIHQGNLLIR